MNSPVLTSLLRINRRRMVALRRVLTPHGYVGFMRPQGLAQSGAEHIHHRHPAVGGQGQALQPDGQRAHGLHLRVRFGEEGDERFGKDRQQHAHDRRAGDRRPGGSWGRSYPWAPPLCSATAWR